MKFPVLTPLAALLFPPLPAHAQDPFPGGLPGTEIGSGLSAFYEPSGAVWHPRFWRLFLVDDGGTLTSMGSNGQLPVNVAVPGDLEGVCYADPSTNLLYVGREHPDAILEVEWPSGTVLRTFDLTPWMTGPSNLGLEALTFIPIPGHPEQGLFYAGLQDDGQIYVFELPIVTSAVLTTVTHVTTFDPAPSLGDDLSGLDFDREEGVLYSLFDSHNVIVATEPDGTPLSAWVTPPGNDEEGIAIRGCTLFLAEDVGTEVWRYADFPDGTGCHTLDVVPPALSVAAGGTQFFTLTPGAAFAGDFALTLGTISGTSPGIVLGGEPVPLNLDPWLLHTLGNPNSPPYFGSLSVVDLLGNATASFVLPAGARPVLVGRTVHHAFLVIDAGGGTIAHVSNPAPLNLLP